VSRALALFEARPQGHPNAMNHLGPHAVAAEHVFDGVSLHARAAVIIEGSNIVAVVPQAELPAGSRVCALPKSAWLAPGFIDLQVNGGDDLLFNDNPTVPTIAAIAAAHRKFGTTAFLPTLISDSPAKMRAALDAVQAAIDNEPGVLGIHFEGPFLSPGKAGIHDVRAIRPPTPADKEILALPRKGEMLMTLAPEEAPRGFLAELTRTGICLSLGHSMATYAQTRQAMAEGVTGFTHLFNAMRPLESREPGPIAAALESPDAWYGLIVDGVHVDPAMLRVALRGAGHPMLVTDAMPPVGGRQSTFSLYGRQITSQGGRCTDANGTLAGSVLTMAEAVCNCAKLTGTPLPAALRFASTNPARFIGLGHALGRLAPGYRADMVAFEPGSIKILATWVAGAGVRDETAAIGIATSENRGSGLNLS
jgi:N-acetylglucosamine-6-phosphate deacetylase